jgi:hypothetical protein
MGTITIVNKHYLGPIHPFEEVERVPIHRGTPLGNPFKMVSYNQKERDRVCDEYDTWVRAKLLEPGAELEQLMTLVSLAKDGKDIELVCFCVPKRCHGETIKRLIEEKLNEDCNDVAPKL